MNKAILHRLYAAANTSGGDIIEKQKVSGIIYWPYFHLSYLKDKQFHSTSRTNAMRDGLVGERVYSSIQNSKALF